MCTTCPICYHKVEADAELQDGQHVVCPYCKSKFEFHMDGCCPVHEARGKTGGEPAKENKKVDIGTWAYEQKSLELLKVIKQQLGVVILLLSVIVLGQIGGCSLLSDIKNKSYEFRSY